MTTAIKPDFFHNVPAMKAVEDKKGEVTGEETALYAMSKSAGWKIFEGFMTDASAQLDNINKEAIAGGQPLEEIGRNAIVVNLAQEAIKRLLDKVSDAVEAVESE